MIAERTSELQVFFNRNFGARHADLSHGSGAGCIRFSDEDVIRRAGAADNGVKFTTLWAGDTSEHGGDDSAADLALLSILAFWTQDVDQLDRLFRLSGLYRPKWERPDYRERTIATALKRSSIYQDNGRVPAGNANGHHPQAIRPSEDVAVHEQTVSDVSAEAWPERQPLPPRVPPAPTLPESMVPVPLRSWLVETANRTRIPLEMPAVAAIVAGGGLIGRTIGIRPWEYEDFTVVPNLWGAIVARPGWMKTESYKEPFRPVGKLIAQATLEYDQERQRMDGKKARTDAEVKAIQRRLNAAARGEPPKSGQDVESLDTLEAACAAKRVEASAAIAVERRYVTQDATVEKFGELLCHNPRGMMLLRDELSGWLLQLNKSGREGDREFYLEAWNGTSPFTVDRISRGTLHIPSLTVSVFGTIQPGKLKPLISSAIGGGAGDDGMLQRFQLLVYPDALPAWEKPSGWGDVEAKARADAIYAALDTLTPEQVGAQPGDIPYLRFSPAAQAVADQWRDELEQRLRSGELDTMPAFASHVSKYRSLMPALALIFYLIDVAAKTPGIMKGSVGETHVRLAAAWCDFLEAHARKLYAAETAAGIAAAHALAEKILSGAEVEGQPVRNLYRKGWSGLNSPESVWDGLTTLAELGWLRIESRMTGANPSQIVRLNPDVLSSVETEEEYRG